MNSLFNDYLARISTLEKRIAELEESRNMLQDTITKQKGEIYQANKRYLMLKIKLFKCKMFVDKMAEPMALDAEPL